MHFPTVTVTKFMLNNAKIFTLFSRQTMFKKKKQGEGELKARFQNQGPQATLRRGAGEQVWPSVGLGFPAPDLLRCGRISPWF